MTKRKIRVLVVDDHPIVREGLASLLSRQPGFEVCGEAADVRHALELVDQARPDVVTIDLSLADGSGLELIRRIAEKLEKSAKDKRLDGATLAYVDMTLSCVECHKYVRNVLIAKP